MRRTDKRSGELFSCVELEQRVRDDHPSRAIRWIVSEALDTLSGEFTALYSGIGRPSIPPEMLLRAIVEEDPAHAGLPPSQAARV